METNKEKIDVVEQPRTPGIFISYAAATLVVPLLMLISGLGLTDHSAIGHLDDKLEFLSTRLVDGTVVARLVDHDMNISERLKVVDDRLKNLEVFAGASTSDRAAIHFELNTWREWLRYQGRTTPPAPATPGAPGSPEHDGHP